MAPRVRLLACLTLFALGWGVAFCAAAVAIGPELHLDPDEASRGAPFTAYAFGFLPGEKLAWYWDGEPIDPVGEAPIRARADGSSSQHFSVPGAAAPGRHVVSVVGETEASATASFFVTNRSTSPVYRLPSSTTSTVVSSTTTTEAAEAIGPASRDESTPTGGRRARTTTTERESRDVPEQFGLIFEGGGGGPPSWLPALVPAAIVAAVAGRFVVRHLSREDT